MWQEDVCVGETCDECMPGYLSGEVEQEWGKQGPDVVVCDCGSIIPARGTLDGYKYDTVQRACPNRDGYTYGPNIMDCDYVTYFDTYFIRTSLHQYMVLFDGSIFKVNRSSTSPLQVYGGITVTLVNGDCATLEKARNAKVYILAQRLRYVRYTPGGGLVAAFCNYHGALAGEELCGGCWNPTSEDNKCDLYYKAILDAPQLIAMVGVKFKPSDFLEKYCSGPDSPPNPLGAGPGGCGGGCAKGNCGGNSFLPKIQIRNANDAISSDQTNTLSFYGGINHYLGNRVETNISGFWHWTADRPGWSIHYEQGTSYAIGSGENYTGVAFYVQDPLGNKYHYSKTGNWTSAEQAYGSTYGSSRW